LLNGSRFWSDIEAETITKLLFSYIHVYVNYFMHGIFSFFALTCIKLRDFDFVLFQLYFHMCTLSNWYLCVL
jgi:hypothetical protein